MSKTGIVLPYWTNISKEEIIYFSKLADELGYDSIWVPEMWGRDAFTIISTICHHTQNIKVGTGIVSVFSRSPAMIAQTAATIDDFSGGRMIIGLGMSSVYITENWHGFKFENTLQRTRECVEIIKLVLSEHLL